MACNRVSGVCGRRLCAATVTSKMAYGTNARVLPDVARTHSQCPDVLRGAKCSMPLGSACSLGSTSGPLSKLAVIDRVPGAAQRPLGAGGSGGDLDVRLAVAAAQRDARVVAAPVPAAAYARSKPQYSPATS